uniref:Death domain-containing protein n=1 Tax=Amphimedon queenslandica TaxID=400682 RepID=A0A1X7SE95_AMPQE
MRLPQTYSVQAFKNKPSSSTKKAGLAPPTLTRSDHVGVVTEPRPSLQNLSSMASPERADNTNQLQITDLTKVLQLLKRHGYSGTTYYELGLFFGLSPATLDIITKNNRDDVKSCLRECLTKWLEKADKIQETKGGPSIYSLVSALRELEQKAVADKIDKE